MLKKRFFLISSALLISTMVFVACSAGGRTRSTDSTAAAAASSDQTTQASLCSTVTPEVLETDDRVASWGGISIYRMLSDECYQDAKACNFYKNEDCQLWMWTQDDRNAMVVAYPGLSFTHLCDGTDPNCDSTYIFKFIRCDSDIYLLSILGRSNSALLNCSHKSDPTVSPFKVGSIDSGIGISQINNQVFILAPTKAKSLVIDISSAKKTVAGDWEGDVPSVQNFIADELVTCLKSLTSDSYIEGAYCTPINWTYNAGSDILM